MTLKKTENSWAKPTLEPGLSVLACDPNSGSFAVRFDDVTLEQYGKASAGGLSVGGWNFIWSMSGQLRVSFSLIFTPPGTVLLSNLSVVDINFVNLPDWVDSDVIRIALNVTFPITFTI